MAVALDGLLEQLMISSRTSRNDIWRGHAVVQALGQQLQYVTGGRAGEVGSACIAMFRTLLYPDVLDVLTTSTSHVIITESIRLLSHVDCGLDAAVFLGDCLGCPTLASLMKEMGVVDGLFALFFKFKQSVNILSEVLGVYVGPFYTVFTLSAISQSLNSVLRAQTAHSAAQMFTPDHARSIKQLHEVICEELRRGRLVESDELHVLCDDVLLLLTGIVEVHVSADSAYADTLKEEYGPFTDSWMELLNAASIDGFMTRAQLDICVVAYPQWSGDRAFGPLESEYTLIVPHTVTLELLRSYYVALFQNNVIINTVDVEGNLSPMTSQGELERAIRQCTGSGTDKHVMEVYLTVDAGQVGGDALGLMPKEVALRELQNFLSMNNRRIHRQMMSDFYDLMLASNSAEITMNQFIGALTGDKLQFPEQAAIDIFRAFDFDGNDRLSLNEIGLGFAMLVDGSLDDKLQLMFQAYDTNRDNVLSKDELVYLLIAATGRSQAECSAYADKVGRHADKNQDGVIDFSEFRSAVYGNHIPLGALWSDGVVLRAIERAYSPYIHRRNAQTVPAVDFRGVARQQQHPRSRSMFIPREFMNPSSAGFSRGRSQTTIARDKQGQETKVSDWHRPSPCGPLNRKPAWGAQQQGHNQYQLTQSTGQQQPPYKQQQARGGKAGTGYKGNRQRR